MKFDMSEWKWCILITQNGAHNITMINGINVNNNHINHDKRFSNIITTS